MRALEAKDENSEAALPNDCMAANEALAVLKREPFLALEEEICHAGCSPSNSKGMAARLSWSCFDECWTEEERAPINEFLNDETFARQDWAKR